MLATGVRPNIQLAQRSACLSARHYRGPSAGDRAAGGLALLANVAKLTARPGDWWRLSAPG
ncbi:hypothetical protein UA70_21895 [Raoultella planticola]|nr:hypothetical protein UA70_21895 [Raoultella planticola]